MKALRKLVILLMWAIVLACVVFSMMNGELLAATGWLFGAAVAIPVFLPDIMPQKPKQEEKPQMAEPLASGKEERTAIYRKKYGEMLSRLDISENGGLVGKMSGVFSLLGVQLVHFCWRDGDRLYFFPQWSDIEGYLKSPEYVKPYKPGDEDNLYVLDIPVENIEYFKRDGDNPDEQDPEAPERGEVLLRYRNAVNQVAMLPLSVGSYETLEALIPEKDYQLVFAGKYPRSAQQIANIRDQLQSLKEQWDQGFISDDDYIDRRKTLLTQL